MRPGVSRSWGRSWGGKVSSSPSSCSVLQLSLLQHGRRGTENCEQQIAQPGTGNLSILRGVWESWLPLSSKPSWDWDLLQQTMDERYPLSLGGSFCNWHIQPLIWDILIHTQREISFAELLPPALTCSVPDNIAPGLPGLSENIVPSGHKFTVYNCSDLTLGLTTAVPLKTSSKNPPWSLVVTVILCCFLS